MRTFPLLLSAAALVSCTKAPPEPTPTKDPGAGSASPIPTAASNPEIGGSVTMSVGSSTPTTGAIVKRGGSDPLDGKWTLADATKDLKGPGALVAKIETSKGTLECKLFDDKAPTTVANFIGLATGARPFKDPKDRSGNWVSRPAYDGTTFHRVIKGFMIQGGDPTGSGAGEPGYVIPDELWAGAKHDHAGQLCMANRGANTNGMQFFITDAAAPHLDRGYTIFGECAPVQVVHDIADVSVAGERPVTPVVIRKVTVSREAPPKK
jgi:peptidyl-prolyl cis-trans isomerase A (cyclophilin A)